MVNGNGNGNGRRWYDLYTTIASVLFGILILIVGWVWVQSMGRVSAVEVKVQDNAKVNGAQDVQIKETQTDIKYIKLQQNQIYTRQEAQMDKMDQIILQTKDK